MVQQAKGFIAKAALAALCVLIWQRAGLAGDGLPPAWIKASGVPVLGWRVVNQFAHDRNAFTQGLLVADGADPAHLAIGPGVCL